VTTDTYAQGDENTKNWSLVETQPDSDETCKYKCSETEAPKDGAGKVTFVAPPGPLFRLTAAKILLKSESNHDRSVVLRAVDVD
jgi:hypothetical protein